LTKSSISLIKSWLDISNLWSTKKKPCRFISRAFLFSARAELAQARLKSKKTRNAPHADAGLFF
jgi:hypothetical protein